MGGKVRVEGPPTYGVTGDTVGRLKPRADFRTKDFDRLIDAQGSRLAWARAMRCPCAPVNSQTQQPDPRCPRCQPHPGWTFFGPANYEIPANVGQLDALQRTLITQYGAAVIRGVMVGISEREEPMGKVGPWRFGQGTVTVRPENVLGYYDRLVDLDSEISYSEVLEVTWSGRPAVADQPVTRYPVVGLNHALDQDGRVFLQGPDLELTREGVLRWRPGKAPAAGTRLGVAYLTHAHWRVVSQPHVMRRSQVLTKIKAPETPLGTPTALPVQAQVMLDHLIEAP